MIWNPSSADMYSEAASVIAAELDTFCEADCLVESRDVEEIGKAIDFYLCEREDDDGAAGEYVLMLASRALASLGKRGEAQRMLVFGTGLARPAEWAVTGDETLWVLDLKRMTVHENGRLEMAFFNALMIVLDCVAEALDRRGGGGVLGLRHVCSTAAAILGDKNGRDMESLAAEIVGLCATKLERISRERRWEKSPRVMNLDF